MRKFKSKRINKKYFLFAIILCISIGFAMLTANLSINGSFAFRNHTFDVHFDNIELDEESISDVGPTLDSSKTNMSFSVNLSQPEDFYKFKFDVVNGGDVDAMINKIEVTGIPSELNDIIDYELKYSNTRDVELYHKLLAGQLLNMYFIVFYKDIEASQIPTVASSLNINIDVEYVISDANGIDLHTAYLETGRNVNTTIKRLSGTTNANYFSNNSTIKSIKYSSTLDITPTSSNIVSLSSSEYPIYMWFVEDTESGDGTGDIYWYSDAFFIDMNSVSSFMFRYLNALTDINSLSMWNASNVIQASCIFLNCFVLEDFSSLSYWNTENINTIYGFFWACRRLTNITPISNWDVTSVTDMSYLFDECELLEDLKPLSKWNTSSLTTMSNIFSGCHSITSLNGLENFNLNSVQSLYGCFYYCKNLTDLSAISNWNLSSISGIPLLFNNCGFSDLSPLANWDVSNISNFSTAFYGCSNLIDLTPISGWNTSNASNISSMFAFCNSLVDASPLENWDVSNVTNMSNMFSNNTTIRPSWYV